MTQENAKMTEEEIVDKCISAGLYALHCIYSTAASLFHKEEELLRPVHLSKGTRAEIRKLRLISNSDDIRCYYNAYVGKHRELTLKEPNYIEFRGFYFFKIPDFNGVNNLKITDSKLDLVRQDLVAIWQLVSCDVFTSEVRFVKLEYASRCVFRSRLELLDSNLTVFDECNFQHQVVARNIEINNSYIAYLKSAHESSIIKNSLLERAQMLTANITLQDSILDDVQFINPAFSSATIIDGITFKSTPKISVSEFASKNVSFRNCRFSDTKSGEALGTFRQLKKMCEDAGYEHGAIEFHGYELETHYNLHLKHNCPSGHWPEKVASIIHREFCDYGRNLMRPFRYLLAIFLVCLIGYHSSYSMCSDLKPCEAALEALHFSTRNLLVPFVFLSPEAFKIIKPPTDFGVVLGFIQASVSTIIWFLIVFMIRRRFKL
jgi:hypothetical protein